MILDIPLIVLAFGGLANAVYAVRLTHRCSNGSCSLVFGTKYARLLGFPNSYLGVGFYLGLMAFGIDRSIRGPVLPLWPALAASAVGMLVSVYLAYILFLKLKET